MSFRKDQYPAVTLGHELITIYSPVSFLFDYARLSWDCKTHNRSGEVDLGIPAFFPGREVMRETAALECSFDEEE